MITALPRRSAALQYRAVRLPYTVLEKQVVGRLADGNWLRLRYEDALGRADAGVGRLTGDRELAERGSALQRRVQTLRTRAAMLAKAEQLDAKAQARQQTAEQTLQSEKDRAEQERRQARRAQQEGVQEALVDGEVQKRRVAAEADAAERAEKERVEEQAADRKQSADQRLEARQQRIAAEERAATAAPKGQLEDAVELAQAVDQRRDRAERMGELADAEAESRRAARETSRQA